MPQSLIASDCETSSHKSNTVVSLTGITANHNSIHADNDHGNGNYNTRTQTTTQTTTTMSSNQPYQLLGSNSNSNSNDHTNANVHDENNSDGNHHRDHDASDRTMAHAITAQRTTMQNFVLMSILFSANHGCVVACLALATDQLGTAGAWQSGVLYLTYTASALLGATYLVKQCGPRNALIVGMGLYCIYVTCFWIATRWDEQKVTLALLGAGIGGIGAGCLWTAQGAYFSKAAEEHAYYKQREAMCADDLSRTANGPREGGNTGGTCVVSPSMLSTSTSYLAGIFAFLYLAEEVVLRLLSTALRQFNIASWGTVFAIYTLVSLISVAGMFVVRDYSAASPNPAAAAESDSVATSEAESTSAIWYKVTAAIQLLRTDAKMKYMIGANAVFGLTGAFLNSYVNGQVVPFALSSGKDSDSEDGGKYIGLLTAWVSMTAAIMSLVLGRVSNVYGKATVLIFGSICFIGVVVPFVLFPLETYAGDAPEPTTTGASSSSSNSSPWGWTLLLLVYTLHGTGRATFESTLKATFADYFPQEKEGAFANIIWQNGISGAIGYILTFALTCPPTSEEEPAQWGCMRYNDGSYHDVGSFEVLCLTTGVLAVVGLLRAGKLYEQEQIERQDQENEGLVGGWNESNEGAAGLQPNDDAVSA